MQAWLTRGMICIALTAPLGSEAASGYAPSGTWTCDGELVIFERDPKKPDFRRSPIRGTTIRVDGQQVIVKGDVNSDGSYTIDPAQTSPIQVFFSGTRGRSGSLRNDGQVRVHADRSGSTPGWRVDLQCRRT